LEVAQLEECARQVWARQVLFGNLIDTNGYIPLSGEISAVSVFTFGLIEEPGSPRRSSCWSFRVESDGTVWWSSSWIFDRPLQSVDSLGATASIAEGERLVLLKVLQAFLADGICFDFTVRPEGPLVSIPLP
jgi:hypothetical protein